MSSQNEPLSGLSYERMLALVKLQESRSLFEAAGRSPLTQSRYSHYLKELSSHFGVKLTERHGRNLKLTAQGIALANLAREHFKSLDAFKVAAGQATEEWAVGADPEILRRLVIPALAKTRKKDALRVTRLVSAPPDRMAIQIAEGSLDFGILRRAVLPTSLTAVDAFSIRHVVAIPRRLLPPGGTMKVAKVLGEMPHAIGNDDILAASVGNIARRHGTFFRPELRCTNTAECVAAVKSGHFASIIPAHALEQENAGDWVIFEHEAFHDLEEKVALAWSAHNLTLHGPNGAPFKSELLAALKEEATSLGIEV